MSAPRATASPPPFIFPRASGFADGRIFILERAGKIKIVKNGQLLPTPFADLPSEDTGDRGLIGIAFDPDFGVSNHFVYFYYTGHDLLNHLVRFSAAEDVGTDGPYELFQTSSPSQLLHVGGSIRFGPDGKLYFAVGDNGQGDNAQDLSNPHGKILRINKDGSIPADNPFVGSPASWGRSGRTDSATRGASSSTARPASCTAATWATSAGRSSTTSSRVATTAGRCMKGHVHALRRLHRPDPRLSNHDGDSARGHRRARSTAASMFPPEYQGDLFFATTHRASSSTLTSMPPVTSQPSRTSTTRRAAWST